MTRNSLILLLIVSVLLLPCPVFGDTSWQSQTVHPGKVWFSRMSDNSLSLDADGNAHIAYGGLRLEHAWQQDGQWYFEVVDDSPHVGLDTALALDSDGYVHISYFDVDNDDLKYAFQDGDGWQVETVDIEGGNFTSIALDPDGWPHISYFKRQHAELRHAWRDRYGWNIEVVDQPGGSGSSMAIDSSGFVQISYASGRKLKVAREAQEGWQISVVEAEIILGRNTSLCLDSYGDPCLSYYDRGRGQLKLARLAEDGYWRVEVVSEELEETNQHCSLALTEGDWARIAFYDTYSQNLMYARETTNGWQVDTVRRRGEVGRWVSLALDQEGYAHVNFYDVEQKSLHYALQSDTGWQIEPAFGAVR